MHTDPIADMLTRIRNANMVLMPEAKMPSSKLKVEVARILAAEGFIDSFAENDASVGKELTIRLRYSQDRSPVLKGLRRVSKPGNRVYKGAKDLDRVRGGIGVSIVSTSQGLLSDRDARAANIGGEVLCEAW